MSSEFACAATAPCYGSTRAIFEPEVGQRVVIATEDGERTARVAVGRTAAPPGSPFRPLRVLWPADQPPPMHPTTLVGARVDAIDPPPRHAPPPVGTRRMARLDQPHPRRAPTA